MTEVTKKKTTNTNITVRRNWTHVGYVSGKWLFSNNSKSSIEWLVQHAQVAPNVPYGHILPGGGQIEDFNKGHLYAKVSPANQGTPLSTVGVLTDIVEWNEIAYIGPTEIDDFVLIKNLEDQTIATAQWFDGDYIPFTYALEEGTLPTGLSVVSGTGVISGTPTTAQEAEGIIIQATDANSNTADTSAFKIEIINSIEYIGDDPLDDYELTQNEEGQTIDVSELFESDYDPITYALHAGTLPTGMSLNVETGIISGTPTTVQKQEGIVIRATDALTNTADTVAFDVDIKAP